jgi:hypothetical protein
MDPCMANLHFLFPVFAMDLSSQQPGMRICCFVHVCVSVCTANVCVVCIFVCVCGMVWRYGKEIAGERQSKARCPVVFFLLDANQRQDIDRSMNRHGFYNPYLIVATAKPGKIICFHDVIIFCCFVE